MSTKYFTVFLGLLIATFTLTKTYAQAPEPKPEVAVVFLKNGSTNSYPRVLFHFNGFPKNQEILVSIQRPLVKKIHQIDSFSINDVREVISSNKSEKEALEMTAQGFLPGERAKVSFQNKEGQTLVSVSIIPYKISCEIPEEKLALGAELVSIFPLTNYELTLDGVQDGEKLILQSKSGKETIRHELTYKSNNKLAIAPGVLGVQGGIGEVSIITKKGTLSLKLPWGSKLVPSPMPEQKSYKAPISHI